MKTEAYHNGWFSILVVDDDRAMSKLIRHNLADKSTQVFEAATGLDSLKILREVRIDLILLDLGLPDLNGWGVLSFIRSAEPLRHTPVIVISVEPPNRALMEHFQLDDYIQKPFDIRDLVVRVRKVINSAGSGHSSLTKPGDGGT